MSPLSIRRTKLWRQAAAAAACLTTLAGVVKALEGIATDGGSALGLVNATLLYVGNVAACVFVAFVVLAVVAAWATDGKSAGTSDGAAIGVAGVAAAGGIYWGITGDLVFNPLATRAIGGALLALLAAAVAYHTAPAPPPPAADPGAPAAAEAWSPGAVNAAVAGGVIGLAALVVIALGKNSAAGAAAAELTAGGWVVTRSDQVTERFTFHPGGAVMCESPAGSGQVFQGSWAVRDRTVSVHLDPCWLTGVVGNKEIHGTARHPARGQWTWVARRSDGEGGPPRPPRASP